MRLFQYGNPANPLAHYEGTGPEIWRDCPEVDVFVAGLGTSGTLMGVGRYLKEQKPAVQVVAVEPPAGELVQGLRNLDDGFVPPIFDPDGARPEVHRAPRESIEWLRRLLDDCGVFAGISSGAAVAGAAKMAAHDGRRARSSRCCPTAGWKYLSSGAWTDDLDEVVERATPHQLLVAVGCPSRTAAEIARARPRCCARGGLVAFPTETVYGLGADASSPDARAPALRGEGPPAPTTR